MDIYKKRILDHYKSPRNFGVISGKKTSHHRENPSCGDSISMDVVIEKEVIKNIKFSGEGCAIAIASTSMLTEKVTGMKIQEIADLDAASIEEMLGIKLSPARKKCGVLGLNVLKKIILKELKK